MELDSLTFKYLLRDAICLSYQETEKGREYLKDCWRFEQTEPDWNAIAKFNGLQQQS